MSDDSVEFGGFGPTTPGHPRMKPKPKARTASTAKPLTRQKATATAQDPGPSKRANGNTDSGRPAKRKKDVEEIVAQSEDEAEARAEVGMIPNDVEEEIRIPVEDVVASSDEDEMRNEVEKQRLNGKAKGRTNGRTQQTRGKSGPSTSKQSAKTSKKALEVEGSEEEQGVEDDVIHIEVPPTRESRAGKASEKTNPARSKTQASRRKGQGAIDVDEIFEGQDGVTALVDKIGRPSVSGSGGATSSVKDPELARMKEKISRLEDENKSLSAQMEELFRVRQTEAEALMQRSEEQYEAKIRALEEVDQALTEQLTKKQPFAGIGRSTQLNFITRDVADAEKQTLDKEIGRLKGELSDAIKALSLKDQEIGEMKQLERDLRFELKAEIDRAATLAKQAPRHQQPTPRSGHVAEDPKHREAIKLYEDLTNIIVLNIRSAPGQNGQKDEWSFNCCYTHTNETDSVNPATRSLSFSLRSYEQPDDEGHLRDWIQYLPTSLDKEPESFTEKLGFLNAAFQFERNQLALFLRTLYTTVEDIVKGEEESDPEDSIQEVTVQR